MVSILANSTFTTLKDGCTERANNLQMTADSIEKHLKNIAIDDSLPDEVKARKNGDCLTGTGAIGTARYVHFSYLNAAEANRGVAKVVHAQDEKSFTLGDNDEDGYIEFIETRLFDTVDNKTYDVKYYLTEKIKCPGHEYESDTCIKGETPEAKQAYLHKPINRIELSLRM